jgi:Single Cache domain 2
MFRRTLLAAIPAAALIASAKAASAQGSKSGTAAEARAMLDKAVAAVKADKEKALAAFNGGTDGFRDRDLYPFCIDTKTELFTAHPSLRGTKARELKDAVGNDLGEQLIEAGAKEGELNETAYFFPRPGTTLPMPKLSYIMRVGDQICGVGYYK